MNPYIKTTILAAICSTWFFQAEADRATAPEQGLEQTQVGFCAPVLGASSCGAVAFGFGKASGYQIEYVIVAGGGPGGQGVTGGALTSAGGGAGGLIDGIALVKPGESLLLWGLAEPLH
jgi:hypothetical protein